MPGCNNFIGEDSSLTHTDNGQKEKTSFSWKAPSIGLEGETLQQYL